MTLNNYLARQKILFLMRFRPVKLFERLYELPWYKHVLHQWVSDLKIPTASEVLELGCASGMLTEQLSYSGYLTTGVDASLKMINAAKARRDHRSSYHMADATKLDLDTFSFDAVISASLLNVVESPKRLVLEMSRVGRCKGRIAVLVPRQGITDEEIQELIEAKCDTDFSKEALWVWHRYARKMRTDTIEALFRLAGLQEIKSTEYLDRLLVSVTGIKS